MNGNINSEITEAWLVKLEQVMQKARLLFDDKELVKVEKQYEVILKKLNREKKIKSAKKIGVAMAELIPVLPQFIIIFVWILSMMILMPKCHASINEDTASLNLLLIILIYIAGAIFIPLTLRCASVLLKLETTIGIILSIVLNISLLKIKDESEFSLYLLLLLVGIICVIVIIVRSVKQNKKISERSAAFNISSLIIVLISLLIWLIVYGVGSIGYYSKQIEDRNISQVITSDKQNDDDNGTHTYEIRNYVGRNVASIGKMYGNNLVDEYGDAEVNLVYFTEDGMLVLPNDEETKKNYVVVSQNTESGSSITVVNEIDSDGEPYSLVDYQSIDEIILYIAPINTFFEPQITIIEPTLDKHKYHIKDYVGRNAASFGDFYGNERVDKYNNVELRLSFVTEDGSYVDSTDLNELKNYIVVSQDIAPNTELLIEYDIDSRGNENNYLIEYQNYEEIILVIKELDDSIIEQLPYIEEQE